MNEGNEVKSLRNTSIGSLKLMLPKTTDKYQCVSNVCCIFYSRQKTSRQKTYTNCDYGYSMRTVLVLTL